VLQKLSVKIRGVRAWKVVLRQHQIVAKVVRNRQLLHQRQERPAVAGSDHIAPFVLVISGLTRPDLQAKIDRLGNAKLLRKPFGIPELRAAVADLMAAQA
jgi:CheY-like chemotaxis protein